MNRSLTNLRRSKYHMKKRLIKYIKNAIMEVKEILLFGACQDMGRLQYGIIPNVAQLKALYEVEMVVGNSKPFKKEIEAESYKNAINRTKDEYFGCKIIDIHFKEITKVTWIALNQS
jgi:hypothetical protein